jgi:DNA-binding transcriptional ArsR family regulator
MLTEIWELCRKLANLERRTLLRKVCEARDGLNVGIAHEGNDGLKQSGTSQYLGQLWKLGLIRRVRSGKYVNYYADAENANALVRDVALALQERFRAEAGGSGCDEGYLPVMRVMGNAMRARIVGMLAREGQSNREYICDRLGLDFRTLDRHLKPAIDMGLVECGEGDILRLNLPSDPIARLIVKAAV